MTAPDPALTDELMEAVYLELRRRARHQLAAQDRTPTLQATALVHEVWLRLRGEGRPRWESRAQFFVAAAEALRRVQVDAVRARTRLKRGGAARRCSLDELQALPPAPDRSLLELDEALEELRAFDPRLAELVDLRAFAGLNEDEAAQALGRSARSLRRDWRAARLWLYRRIGELRNGSPRRVS